MIETLIIKLSSLFNINLLRIAYKGIGVSDEFEELPQSFFETILPAHIDRNRSDLVLFDVGANTGSVSKQLLKFFPTANIHAFEPNPHAFATVSKIHNSRFVINKLGLNDSVSEGKIFYYSDDTSTGHASMYREVFDLHRLGTVHHAPIKLSTIDVYCRENNITHIDFLKIDTEGNELKVLKGAKEMLKFVSVIQFEFNEMNIISRVFFKDFYDLLEDFDFFRIKGDKLFAMGPYSSSQEIFRLQNILAINKGAK